MNMREKMQDMLINKRGFEDKSVITFCRLCEKYPDIDEWNEHLCNIFNILMNCSWI